MGAGNENAESCAVGLSAFGDHITLLIRPVRCTYVVIGQADELLCDGYKWVSRFEALCICTQWTGER